LVELATGQRAAAMTNRSGQPRTPSTLHQIRTRPAGRAHHRRRGRA